MPKRREDNDEVPLYLRLFDRDLLDAIKWAALAEKQSMNDFCVKAIAKRVRTIARRDQRIKLTLDMAKEEHRAPEADELEEGGTPMGHE